MKAEVLGVQEHYRNTSNEEEGELLQPTKTTQKPKCSLFTKGVCGQRLKLVTNTKQQRKHTLNSNHKLKSLKMKKTLPLTCKHRGLCWLMLRWQSSHHLNYPSYRPVIVMVKMCSDCPKNVALAPKPICSIERDYNRNTSFKTKHQPLECD